MEITYKQLQKDSKELARKIKLKYNDVFGIPTGGLIPAFIVAKELKIPLVEKPNNRTLIVDDLIDSGRTLEGFKQDSAVLYKKKSSPEPTYYLKEIPDEWLDLPHERLKTGIENNLVRLLEFIGENPNREGLKKTPERIVKMYKEIFRGYDLKKKPKITIFQNRKDGIHYDQMICDNGYFFSYCEHHMVPFFGNYYFAYIPDKKLIGLSKIARLVDYYSARLQVQERLVNDIVDELVKLLNPKGIALVLKGRHLCKEMRGVKKYKGEMITSEMRGVFRNENKVRQEFLKFYDLGSN